MRATITSGYVFNPAARTFDFSGYSNFDVRKLVVVINLTAGGVPIYVPGDDALGYVPTDTSGAVVKLVYNTSGMGANDALKILYDGDLFTAGAPGKVEIVGGNLSIPSGAATADKQDETKDVLESVLTALGPLGTDAKLEAIRLLLASAATASRVTVTQTFPATVVFVNGDTTGSAGSNGTVTQVVAANSSRTFLEIINNGTADCELWFGTKPSDANVGQATKKGVVIPPGGGRVYEARVPTGAIYATTTVAGGLSVLEG